MQCVPVKRDDQPGRLILETRGPGHGYWFGSFLLRGLYIGLAIAMPVGPISLLCLHRILAWGRRAGFASWIGAATADAGYAKRQASA